MMKLTNIYSIVFASVVLCSANGVEKDDAEQLDTSLQKIEQPDTSQNTATLKENQQPTTPMPVKRSPRTDKPKTRFESGSW